MTLKTRVFTRNLNWMPNVGPHFFKGDHIILRLQPSECILNEIKHNIHAQCHGNYIEVKNIQ